MHGQGQRHELRGRRLSSAAGNGIVITCSFFVILLRCLLLGKRDGLFLQGNHDLMRLAVALNPAGGRGVLEAEALRQEGVVGVSKLLEVQIRLAFACLRGDGCDTLLLQTAGDSLRNVVQREAGDLARRNVVLVSVSILIGSAAYVDELDLSARSSLAVVAVRVVLL